APEFTDRPWIFLEVAPEIVNPRVSQSAQYFPAASVIQFEERHRHRLEDMLIARLALPERSFGALALRQIEHEGNALVLVALKHRGANEDGDTTAVLAEILLLERLNGPDRSQFCQRAHVALVPFRRAELRPAHASPVKVFPIISQDTQKRVVGFANLTLE